MFSLSTHKILGSPTSNPSAAPQGPQVEVQFPQNGTCAFPIRVLSDYPLLCHWLISTRLLVLCVIVPSLSQRSNSPALSLLVLSIPMVSALVILSKFPVYLSISPTSGQKNGHTVFLK